MNYFQFERLPDAMRTLFRFTVSFTPIFLPLMFFPRHVYSGYEAIHFQELIRFESALASALWLCFASSATLVFAMWQAEARNPFTDEGGLGWLTIHGWEGDVSKLPQRGLLSLTELLGIVIATVACFLVVPAALVFLPMCWSLVRLKACWTKSHLEHPYHVGFIAILHSAAILWCDTVLLAFPVELAAIIVSEYLMINALVRKAKDAINSDIRIFTKQSSFASANSQTVRRRETTRRNRQQLFPFSQLSPDIELVRLSWAMSLWVSVTVGWLMFCITTRIARFGEFTNEEGAKIPVHQITGLGCVLLIETIGLTRYLSQFDPFAWRPRTGLFARIKLLRPIVWSWDRFLLPHLINLTLILMIAPVRGSMTPFAFASLAFIEVLVLLRCGVSVEDWQMTSDARLARPQESLV